MSDKARPAHKFRDRNLTVTVWKNQGENGPWYSVTPARTYKQGELYKESDSYSDDELLRLSVLLQDAYRWIRDAAQADRQAAAESQAA
jgi:hypothetical protein